MTAERSDTGMQQHLHRGELYRRAHKVRALADIIMDITGTGRVADTARAERLFARIIAIIGHGEEE